MPVSISIFANGFQPYIHVEGEHSVPSGITLFAATGGSHWHTIPLPVPLTASPVSEQLATVPDLIRDYLTRYQGFCPFFGRAVAFWLIRQEESYRFDLHGVLIGRIEGAFRRPEAELRIGNRTIQSLFPLRS